MMKLPIRYFTNFNEDTDELEFPQHTGVDFYWEQTKSKEIGNVAGVSIMVNPETYEDIKKQKTIYENKILNELQQRIDKAIEYIRENCILSDCWEDLDFCNFVPVGRIKYKSLSSKKVKELLDILKGSEK